MVKGLTVPAGLPRWITPGLAFALALPLAALTEVGTFRLLEARLFDVMSTLAPPRPPEPGAIIVAIDEPSLAEVGQRWPWDRSLHATLIQRLRQAGAKVIALDIVFAEPSSPKGDEALASALGPDTVLAADEVIIDSEHARQVSRVEPLPELQATQAGIGLVGVDRDGDGFVRRLPDPVDGFAAQVLQRAGASKTAPPADALIQYFGPAGTYPTLSYYQALDPERFLPAERLRNATVLVGLSLRTAPALGSRADDAFPTAFTRTTGRLTAGVEVQATVLDNLKHGLFIQPLSPHWIWLATLTAALVAAGLSQTTAGQAGIRAFVLAGALLGGGWLALRYGRVWASPLIPMLAVGTAFAVTVAIDLIRERRARRFISQAFGQYLAPELVERLAREPNALRLGGERRTLSILFCDLRGFTTLSETMEDDPERLTALMNRVLSVLSAPILAEGGTIDKYIGDCIMAFWNAPLAADDHAVRSVKAAFSMIDAIERLNVELAAEADTLGESPVRLAVGIGINTGDCVVGNVGSTWRFNYSALGDAVNIAARLEALSKSYGTPILIGPATAEAARGEWLCREVDEIAVRGRQTAIKIFAPVRSACGVDRSEFDRTASTDGGTVDVRALSLSGQPV
jgi:adenylate cyclase